MGEVRFQVATLRSWNEEKKEEEGIRTHSHPQIGKDEPITFPDLQCSHLYVAQHRDLSGFRLVLDCSDDPLFC